jgi:A/G-specific adenine glycosylase
MLQRTRADLVVPVYEEVVERYPSARALAEAPRREVEALLRPLGYTHRNARIQAAARACEEGVPRALPGLLAIPGVGRYAATATLCFAFGRRLAIVDPNVIRVLGRLGIGSSVRRRPRDDPSLWHRASVLVPRHAAREWNFALLDLGALVCRPRPRCEECPLRALCPTGAAMQLTRQTEPPERRRSDRSG